MFIGSPTIFVLLSQLKAKPIASDGRFSLSLSIDHKNCQRRCLFYSTQVINNLANQQPIDSFLASRSWLTGEKRLSMERQALLNLMNSWTYVFDEGNDINRIIYSHAKEVELKSRARGISIKYVCEGTESYYFEGKEFHVRPGQFLVINHDREVHIKLKSKKEVKGICLYVDPMQLKQLDQYQQQTECQCLDNPFQLPQHQSECREVLSPSSIGPMAQFLHKINHHKTQFNKLESSTMFYNLSDLLWQHDRQLKQRVSNIQASKASTREELHRRLTLSLEYIHSHLGQKLLIKDIAKAAMLSEFHFLRTFKQCYGLSPNQYLTKVRMEKAANLLRHRSSLSIKEIADQCGYQDLHYFSKTFKKTYGRTPSGFKM